MTHATFERELLDEVNRLSEDQQQRVLSFARALTQMVDIRGETGESLLTSIGIFDSSALDEMQKAIDEDCEEIDWRGWE